VSDFPRPPHVVPHLTDAQVAAFIEGSLAELDRVSAATHLAGCDECRAEIVSAASLAASIPRRNRGRLTPVFAAVAAAAAVIAFLWLPSTTNLDQESLERAADKSPRVVVASPADGSIVDSDSVMLSWQSEEGASYRVTITDAGGRTLWTTTTTESHARVPGGGLPADSSIVYWYVDALRADGTSVSSGLQSFIPVRR
jgi:hypothetical protein